MDTTFDFFEQDELPGIDLGAQEAELIALEYFGMTCNASPLGSQQDANFLLVTDDGSRSVLKVANPAFSLAEIEAQEAAVRHLSGSDPALRLPVSRPAMSGSAIEPVEIRGEKALARIITHLDGGTLSGGGYLAPPVIAELGRLAARVTAGLAGFEHEGTVRVLQWDLAHAGEVVARLARHISDPDRRGRVLRAAARASELLDRVSAELPVQVIHGDIADDNVVCSRSLDGYRVPDGVIDFGDLMTSWTVSELAVTIASVLHHAGATPISVLPAIRAFHAMRPLYDAELDALWPLVVLRGAALVASGQQQAAIDSGNNYAESALEHEWRIFALADSVPIEVMTGVIRDAVGRATASAGAIADARLVPSLSDSGSGGGMPVVLDFSSGSDLANAGRWAEPLAELDSAREALAAGAPWAATRYGERRLTRSTPLSWDAPATAALAVDLYLPGEQVVAAPQAGHLERNDATVEIVSAGSRIVLHGVDSDLPTGTRLRAGQRVGTSTLLEPGLSWLGVQLVTGSDRPVPAFVPSALFPGWSVVSPDPTGLLGTLPRDPFPEGAPLPRDQQEADGVELLARRESSFARVQEHYYADPPRIERGWQHTLIDVEARCYLDMVNNVAAVGHAHPRIAEAVFRQLSRLNTNSRFHYSSVVELSERIAALLPEGLDTVLLVNSGSEAVDLALRMAVAWADRPDVVVVREAYHGWTFATDAVSTSVADNPRALETRPGWVHALPAPNAYRGAHRGENAARYGAEAAETIRRLTASGRPPAAFLAEPFYGNAGGMPLPDGYLREVYAAVRQAGGLCIADEVQVGYGRLGHWFWGFEQQGVVPDIVTIAKAMGNGHPLGAVITTREIAERYRNQGYFFSSAGGSPVSSVVGLTVLDILRDENLQANARDVGDHLKAELGKLGDRHELVGAVHGSGLYLGLEFVLDRTTLEPAAAETTAICERMRELGVIIQPTGDRQNVLKIKPPLSLTIEAADFFVETLDRVLTEGYSFDEMTRSN